jgi:hypothetical protein
MINKKYLSGAFDRNDFPKLPCPTCRDGHVTLEKGSLFVDDPPYSVAHRQSSDWEPDWDVGRFSARLRCDQSSCGEIVLVAGDTAVVELEGDDGDWGLVSVLRPQALFPAVPLITMPDQTSSEVHSELHKAFGLFWNDLDAAANRVRVAVERLLDDLGVATTAVNKKGKTIELDLNGRIDAFGKHNADHKDAMTALRMIGNVGSHGKGVVRQALLDALEVFEYTLSELIGMKKQHMGVLKQKLIASKGKYPT